MREPVPTDKCKKKGVSIALKILHCNFLIKKHKKPFWQHKALKIDLFPSGEFPISNFNHMTPNELTFIKPDTMSPNLYQMHVCSVWHHPATHAGSVLSAALRNSHKTA